MESKEFDVQVKKLHSESKHKSKADSIFRKQIPCTWFSFPLTHLHCDQMGHEWEMIRILNESQLYKIIKKEN